MVVKFFLFHRVVCGCFKQDSSKSLHLKKELFTQLSYLLGDKSPIIRMNVRSFLTVELCFDVKFSWTGPNAPTMLI